MGDGVDMEAPRADRLDHVITQHQITHIGLGNQHALLTTQAVLHTHVDGQGRTHVTLLVNVPSDPSGDSFDVKYSVSTGPNGSGLMLAHGETESGKVVIINFILPN